VFFLVFDATSRTWVEGATRRGAQLFALMRAIPNNPRLTLKKTTFFNSLDVWDVLMSRPVEERLAALADAGKRAELRTAAVQRQRRRPGVLGRFVQWDKIVVSKVAHERNRALQGRKLAEIGEAQGTHAADVMLDLALDERLETEFQLQTRSPESDVELADFVRTGHALPSQSDAGAHLNTNFCTAGESSWVLGTWVRDRELLSLEDAIRRYTFQPARIMGLRDRGLVREGLAADLMVFDLERIGVKEDEITRDGPGGTPRRVQGAEGIDWVVVNGKVVLDHGRPSGAFPGKVLRSNR
jgi:N-acyl-D-aspartate/D-glutamate deacylase